MKTNIYSISCLFVILFIVFISSVSWGFSDRAKNLAQKAYRAEQNGKLEEAYNYYKKVLNFGKNEIENHEKKIIINRIFTVCFNMMQKFAKQGNNSLAMKWIEKGIALGPETYEGSVNLYYPILLAFKGMGLYEINKFDDSYEYFIQAQNYIDKSGTNDSSSIEMRNSIKQQIENGLVALQDHILREGTYVTNKEGIIQKWIGKVINRNSNKLTLRITYVNSDAKTNLVKGQSVHYLVNEVKEVTHVSPDAALKGWK